MNVAIQRDQVLPAKPGSDFHHNSPCDTPVPCGPDRVPGSAHYQNQFSKAELLACASGKLFMDGCTHPPAPPLLLLDRVTNIQCDGGHYQHGIVSAEVDLDPQLWFFSSTLARNPVLPGSLAIEAFWQMTALFLGWRGYKGCSRVLDTGQSTFEPAPVSTHTTLTLEAHIRKVAYGKRITAIADGVVRVKGQTILQSANFKVALT